jgi:hypothetical protein
MNPSWLAVGFIDILSFGTDGDSMCKKASLQSI